MVDAAVRTPDHSGSAAYGPYSSGRASNSAGSTASHSRRLLAHRSMTRRPRSLPKGLPSRPHRHRRSRDQHAESFGVQFG